MEDTKTFVQKNGWIKSQAGRIRHLPKAKSIYEKHGEKLMDYKYRAKLYPKYGREEVDNMYKDYKNSINNGYNFQVQSLAASIVNKATIAINREFKNRGIDALVVAQIHDQAIMEVPEDMVDLCKDIIKDKMENTTKISLNLYAPPSVAKNWKDGH